MKTPREILLERHQKAVPKLDALRQEVTETALRKKGEALPVRMALVIWRELIFPSRRIWAGLAAVWLALLVINAVESKQYPAAGQAGLAPGTLQVLAEQNRVLAELLHTSAPLEPKSPRPLPRPRTQGPRAGKAC